MGITPWFSFSFATGRPAYYDPLFSYYAVVNVRQNPGWVAQVREQYVLRRDRVELRPPNTYIEQTRIIERNVSITRNVTVIDHREMAMPLNKMAADLNGGNADGQGRGGRAPAVAPASRPSCINFASSGCSKSGKGLGPEPPAVPRPRGRGR